MNYTTITNEQLQFFIDCSKKQIARELEDISRNTPEPSLLWGRLHEMSHKLIMLEPYDATFYKDMMQVIEELKPINTNEL